MFRFTRRGGTLGRPPKPSPGGRLPLSRGRFPLSGGNGRRPKGVGMMSRSDRGDRERWHGEAVTDEGAMIERFFVGPDALIGPLDGSFRRGISPPAGGELLCPWRLVVAMAQATFSWPFGPIHLESACLRFRLTAKTATAPLLLLFPANPLRWASPGVRERLTKTPPGTRPMDYGYTSLRLGP